MFRIILITCFILSLACGASLKEQRRQSYANQYVGAHPELESTMKTAILRGDPVVGMTKEQVVAAMGQPTDIKQLVKPSGNYERWLCTSERGSSTFYYLDFKNDTLRDWTADVISPK